MSGSKSTSEVWCDLDKAILHKEKYLQISHRPPDTLVANPTMDRDDAQDMYRKGLTYNLRNCDEYGIQSKAQNRK
ncbi:hypothetical protein E5D57_001702 [Metarhizium anisopliae]|nr:hypothetical protein E5D57_001702 [Metarhizium anisopliae]